jgi:uncharacterized membrane protein YgcG
VYRDKSRYVIIQVPPKLIMGAMIKDISRICAVFELSPATEAQQAARAALASGPAPGNGASPAAAQNGNGNGGGCGCGSSGGGGGGSNGGGGCASHN